MRLENDSGKVYEIAPVKRMSILERRAGDTREFFSQHWRNVHGGMVSRLPHLFSYVQNHIVEEFPTAAKSLPGDGFVEQLWRTTGEMQRGYSSPVVKDLIADEVNYLGHGSNYAILAQAALREAPAGSKLMVAVRHAGNVDVADAVVDRAFGLSRSLLRDDVLATIAKANFLPVQPHPVDMFLHVYFSDAKAASEAGRELAESVNSLNLAAASLVGVWRVATVTIVRPPRV